jgi:hypothetical protein
MQVWSDRILSRNTVSAIDLEIVPIPFFSVQILAGFTNVTERDDENV